MASKRLTNYLREAFVRNVGNDVPEVPSPTFEEVQKLVYDAMPAELQVVYDNPALIKCLKTQYYHNGRGSCGYIVTGGLNLDTLLEPVTKRRGARSTTLDKVRAAAYSCRTLKELRNMLPDLVDYMPSEDAPAVKNVPAVIVTIDELKALGFPGENKC